ncbi:DUF3667 domain-containing protein [Chryseobacterium luquanense]|uniref:DUF3667 domain-containing protein n=1 Tax=Chryseobacterium luquanense TaxID=2983766 RepID=A0ABT3Y0X1_9FLAO|nr:DUF3667 domain-containing protein [Chryseobacterium luquanense]MCX8531754.1 DUF3667 domain-containing protein [Chryseobacterium luquanense]
MDATHAECRNCHHSLNEGDKFCSKCGQNTDTHKINLHYVIHELIHGILHLDGGIIHTTKALFTKPGIMIREYLEGKRKNHFSPIIYIVILSTVMVLITHYVYHDKYVEFSLIGDKKPTDIQKKVIEMFGPAFNWVSKHFTLIYLIQIPIMAFAFYIPFKKMSKYNYFEWLLIISFCVIQLMLITITFQLLNRIIPGILFLSNLFVFASLTWTILQLFSKFDLAKVIINYILSLLILFFILSTVAVGGLFSFLSSNPI